MKKLQKIFADKIFIKRLHSQKIFGIAASGLGFAAFAAQAEAQTTIISDDFTSASSQYGTQLTGASPSGVNLPGGAYLLDSYQQGFANEYNFTSVNASNYYGSISTFIAGFTPSGIDGTLVSDGQGVAITLGAFNTGVLAVTGTFAYGPGYNTGGATSPQLGTAYTLLGFSSATTSASNYTAGMSPVTNAGGPNFTGLMALGDGSLQDYVNGVANGSAIAFGGTYSAYSGTQLSYNLDTSTGAISNVLFGASTATYNFGTPGTFSSAYTVSAEIGGSSGTRNGSLSEFSSFSVATAVPEPSTYALLAGGVMALGAFQYRRRQQFGL